VAALAAAALLFLPWLVLLSWEHGSRGPHESLLAYGGLVLALAFVLAHVRLDGQPRSALLIAVVVGVLNVLAWGGFIFLVLVGGSCSDADHGHIPPWAWPVAAVVYLVGGASGLRSRSHAVWAVPLSALVAGGLLILLAVAATGSTGACID
jgi:hypothetical protein